MWCIPKLCDAAFVCQMEQVLDVYQQPFFITYSMGLRLVEALSLQVKDIYAAQMRIHIRLGKNKKDRYVTLPLLALLAMRHYWQTHHHPMLLFPAGSTTRERFRATKHMSKSGVQRTIKKIASDAGIRTSHAAHAAPRQWIYYNPGSIAL